MTYLNSEDVEKLLDRFLREAGPTWPNMRGPSELLEALRLWNGMISCTGPDDSLKASVCSISMTSLQKDVTIEGHFRWPS